MIDFLRPDHYVRTVTGITPEWLRSRRIEALILDLDNTLTGWRDRDVPRTVREWMNAVQASGVRLLVLTNCRSIRRVREVEKRLGIPAIGWASKPRRRGFIRALEALACPPDRVAVVGDQTYTDILGARRAGLCSILVDRLTPNEFVLNRIGRCAQMWAIRRMGLVPREELTAEPLDGQNK